MSDIKLIIKKYIPIVIIPLLTISYGLGDYFLLWDKLSNRHSAELALNKLEVSNEILNDAIGFRDILSFAVNSMPDERDIPITDGIIQINKNHAEKILFKITNGGVTNVLSLLMEYGDEIEFGDSPLILQTLDNPQLEHKTVVFLGSIEGIRKEIKNNKDREQFFVLTLFLGLLGLYIGILAVRKKRTNKAT
jgi:hypothetical protein